MTITVVIPTLNEERALPQTLSHAISLGFDEILVVDGGSTDRTPELVTRFMSQGTRPPSEAAPSGSDASPSRPVIRLLTTAAGRGRQMNAGAAATRSEILVFLHADTRLPADAASLIRRTFANETCLAGRFDVQFEPDTSLARVIAALMNWRSQWTGIMTGDQCLCIRRAVFEQLGGFAEIPLMEDIDFSRRLKTVGRLYVLRPPVTTSYRRWQCRGPLRTILLMWLLRTLYWAGISPHRLHDFYGTVR